MSSTYPNQPGWRATSTGETAREAALANRASARTLQQLCLDLLIDGPQTPEQLRERIEKIRGVPVLITSVRPRLSQAKALGLVTDSGVRGLGEGGRCKAVAWRLTTPKERQARSEASSHD